MDSDPVSQFAKWFEQASETCADFMEPNAMTLSTCSENQITSRTVLLKGYDEKGFVFFTNYDSQKGRQLKENPVAALLFYWPQLERQVRIEGTVAKTDRQRSEEYFHSRPRASQISAAVSKQSALVENRAELEKIASEFEKNLNGEPVPTPDFWGGFVLTPNVFEFWQGGADRLHDRIQYSIGGDGKWIQQRLQP